MSFKPKSTVAENLVTKIPTSNVNLKQTVKSDKLAVVPLIVVALAETSYAATVVATAAAYHWLFGDVQQLAASGNYKTIMLDIDMHNLDKK